MAGLLTALDTGRDEDLLSMHLAGDPHAFGELYAQHYDRLLAHVRRRVRDWHLAEEIVQDTFLRAWDAAEHLKDSRRFYPWLTVIAQRLAIDSFRRTGRVSPVAEFRQELGIEPAADEAVIAACESEALDAALGRVRERHRQVLRWQTEGLSYDDIADRLGAAPTTVAPLLFRARQALRREYLAVTEADRLAAVPFLGALFLSSRRFRARIMQLMSGLPDAGALAIPMAGVAVGMGLWLTPHGDHVQLSDDAASQAAQQLVQQGPVGDEVHSSVRTGQVAGSDAGALRDPPPADHVVGGVEIDFDAQRREWTREQAREMPIYYEVGDMWFSADPGAAQRDIGRTLAGDTGWMEAE